MWQLACCMYVQAEGVPQLAAGVLNSRSKKKYQFLLEILGTAAKHSPLSSYNFNMSAFSISYSVIMLIM